MESFFFFFGMQSVLESHQLGSCFRMVNAVNMLGLCLLSECIYAPMFHISEDEKDSFLEDLQEVINRILPRDILITSNGRLESWSQRKQRLGWGTRY